MKWPQIAMIVWVVLGIGVSMAKHGEPRNSEYSFWTTAISSAIVFFILYQGGFFG